MITSIITEMDHSTDHMVIDSFHKVMDVLKYHEFEEPNEQVCLIYATISKNAMMLSSIHSNPDIVGTLKLEMSRVLKQAVVRIVKVVLDYVGCDYLMNQRVTMMSFRDISLMAYDINRKCENVVKASRGDDVALDSDYVSDLMTTLRDLILRFFSIVEYDEKTISSRNELITENSNDDVCSTKVVVTLGHLISQVAQTVSIIQCNYTKYSRPTPSIVSDNFIKYSNIGSMTLSAILMCYDNDELLQLAVVDGKGSLGNTEKTLMLHLMTLAHLLKVSEVVEQG